MVYSVQADRIVINIIFKMACDWVFLNGIVQNTYPVMQRGVTEVTLFDNFFFVSKF